MGKGKSKYTEMLRFRVPESFKARIKRILEKRGYGGESEVMREAFIRHIEAEEKRLGITPEAPKNDTDSPKPQ